MKEDEDVEDSEGDSDFSEEEENTEGESRKRKLTIDEKKEIKKRRKEEEDTEKELDKKQKISIKKSYQKGCSKTEAFFDVFHLFKDLEKPAEEQVTKWFEQLENSAVKLEIDEDLLKLVEIIDNDYMHFKHFVSDANFPWYPFNNRQSVKGNIEGFFLKNEALPRYAFYLLPNYVEPKQMELKVIDMFHLEQRNFQFFGEKIPWCVVSGMSGALSAHGNEDRTVDISLTCRCYPIDVKYMLICSEPLIYLVYLDYQRGECKILDQKTFQYSEGGAAILFDPEDTKKFVIFNIRTTSLIFDMNDEDLDDNEDDNREEGEESHVYAQIWDVSNGELTSNTKLAIGQHYVSCSRFQNGKLDGFCLEFEENGRRSMRKEKISGLAYWTFEQNQFSKHFKFEELGNFDVKEDFDCYTNYAWFKNECFVMNLSEEYSREDFTNLCSLNVVTQKCTSIFTNFIYSGFYFNSDGNLIVRDDKKLFYYTVKKPQKLENIVWREVNRQKRFFDNENMYKQAMEQLPQNSQFQPFHF